MDNYILFKLMGYDGDYSDCDSSGIKQITAQANNSSFNFIKNTISLLVVVLLIFLPQFTHREN